MSAVVEGHGSRQLLSQLEEEDERGRRTGFERAELVGEAVRGLARRLEGVLERPDEDALEPAVGWRRTVSQCHAAQRAFCGDAPVLGTDAVKYGDRSRRDDHAQVQHRQDHTLPPRQDGRHDDVCSRRRVQLPQVARLDVKLAAQHLLGHVRRHARHRALGVQGRAPHVEPAPDAATARGPPRAARRPQRAFERLGRLEVALPRAALLL